MPQVRCKACAAEIADHSPFSPRVDRNPVITLMAYRQWDGQSRPYGQTVEGIIRCSYDESPTAFKMVDGVLEPTRSHLDEAGALLGKVPPGIKEDVEEAERCHFMSGFKAAATMCRRALQLAFEERGVIVAGNSRPTLGPLLEEARKMDPTMLRRATLALADGIKDIGDAGAHRKETPTEQEAAMVIHITVLVLNELFP